MMFNVVDDGVLMYCVLPLLSTLYTDDISVMLSATAVYTTVYVVLIKKYNRKITDVQY